MGFAVVLYILPNRFSEMTPEHEQDKQKLLPWPASCTCDFRLMPAASPLAATPASLHQENRGMQPLRMLCLAGEEKKKKEYMGNLFIAMLSVIYSCLDGEHDALHDFANGQ